MPGYHGLSSASGDVSSGLAPPQAPCVVFSRWPGARFRQGRGALESWQNFFPAPAQLLASKCSLGPDREIPQCCQLCCWDCHQVSFCWVLQHLIHAWLAGDLQMRYSFVCGPLRGSVCWVISGRAQPLKGQCHRSCCEPTAQDSETLAVSCSGKPLNPPLQKEGKGSEGGVLSPSLLWKLFHLASSN